MCIHDYTLEQLTHLFVSFSLIVLMVEISMSCLLSLLVLALSVSVPASSSISETAPTVSDTRFAGRSSVPLLVAFRRWRLKVRKERR